MNMICSTALIENSAFSEGLSRGKQGIVFVVSDDSECIVKMGAVCDFLDLDVRIVSGCDDLMTMLRVQRPMAVIADLDGTEQDGFHTMKLVAGFNRELPVLLLTDGDPAMMGAADAIQELWGLRSVTLTEGFPAAGQIISFLFSAGRAAGCMRLVPV